LSTADHIVENIETGGDARAIEAVLEGLGRIILGKPDTLRLALTCVLARGHLLIEDVPGMGKTTLAHALARVMGLSYQRIQFTSDLLPADVVGVSMYEREKQVFEFHPGPLFNQLVVADEINRATPKTQSALLEAMEEQQVTVDGVTHALPDPFFVIATQNPTEQVGTYPLPESQRAFDGTRPSANDPGNQSRYLHRASQSAASPSHRDPRGRAAGGLSAGADRTHA
jgi:MoxR-like ATPase